MERVCREWRENVTLKVWSQALLADFRVDTTSLTPRPHPKQLYKALASVRAELFRGQLWHPCDRVLERPLLGQAVELFDGARRHWNALLLRKTFAVHARLTALPPHDDSRMSTFALRAAQAAGAALVATAGAAFAFHTYMSRTFGEDALPRMAAAYRVSVPALADYKLAEAVHERLPAALGRPVDAAELERRYEELHRLHAPLLFDCFKGLRGFYITSGQLIASNIGDAAPRHYQDIFRPFLDHVDHKDFATVRATVERELGGGRALEDVFASFEREPIAAASIGQVHRATLRGSGQAVVVKVQYSEVEAQFRGDVRTAKTFMEVALPQHVPALKEIEKQFASEFDYRREAAQLAAVGETLRRSGLFPNVLVPAPLPELCTKHMLVMEEVAGARKLGDALMEDMACFAALQGVSTQQFIDEQRALDAQALARGELRCGPSAAEMRRFISTRRWRNFLLTPLGYSPLHVPLNHAELVDELFRVHGHEALVDGYFNGDPHPGNVLVAADGRLALVDYGQVKVLTPDMRLRLARALVALACCDSGGANASQRAHVARCLQETGLRTKRGDPEVLFKLASLYLDRDDKLATGGRHVQQYIEELERADPVTQIGDDYVMVVRAALMIRGLGHQLNQHRSLAQEWRGVAEKVMRDAGEDPAAERFY